MSASADFRRWVLVVSRDAFRDTLVVLVAAGATHALAWAPAKWSLELA